MNYLTKIRHQNQLNETELKLGYAGDLTKSWHKDYKDSAWIHVGGLDYGLTEGDLLAVFSQYGEILNVNIMRDYKTLKSKGFAFICYEDQRSTVLAVDNLNGITISGRVIKVDHVAEFRPPKYKESVPPELLKIWAEGCAPKAINISKEDIQRDYQKQEEARQKALAEADKLLPMDNEQLDKKTLKAIKKANKKMKKEEKKLKKREKKEKKRQNRSPTPLEERGTADSVSRWDDKKKKDIDYRKLKDDDFYGSSEHFNFGKKRKEIPQGPTHNIRPDFDKADWRDIEMFKIMREKEKAEKGEKPNTFKEEEHYLPQRFN